MNEELYKKRRAVLQKVFRAGKISHAYLFVGKVNRENEDTIMLLAQILLCLSAEERPCGSCRSCLLFSSKNHPDFRVIESDGGRIKLAEVREICYDTSLNPYLSPSKVYYFKNFDSLTEVAANAFLKTLEEPPPSVYFLALAENDGVILPTIRSRMHRVNLGGFERENLIPPLNSNYLLKGESLFSLFKEAETLSNKDRNQFELELREIQEQYRSLLVSQVLQGQPVNKGLVRVIAAVQRAREYVAANLNLRLLLEDLYLTIYEEFSK